MYMLLALLIAYVFTVDGDCVDKFGNCAKLGCEGYVWNTFTKFYCLDYCGVCPDLHLPNCVDMANNCSLAAKAYCTDPNYQGYMRLHCPAYCGFCSPRNSTQGSASSVYG
ncbi:uncharacterized protein LOC134283883 isoform X2 [Saccostrea cucullata]|uniref:uncharacterized protein LOC134283883 isoform X2 n=1 Tax=Saccostrea cuccullata TaxID=36930 RepID=UPI002ED340F5